MQETSSPVSSASRAKACTPAAIGNVVAFLASDAGCVVGTDLVVDGGALVAVAAD